MTRQTALYINNLLLKIELYERLLDELSDVLCEVEVNDKELETELMSCVQVKLDKLLEELKEL